MPHGGKLSLALRQEGGMAAIEIADTGPGVPAEAKEKIFELYYSTKQKGSGIGLAMAYRAVQLHGGSIEVLDGPEGGALFRVWVPVSTGGVGNEA
jgi:signal transduction histidine kinase